MVRKLMLAALALLVISCVNEGIRYSPYELQEFDQNVQEYIKNGEVAIGMSQQAVRYSWGAPRVVRIRDSVKDAFTEEWIYTSARIMITRLVFTDGKLTAIVSGKAKRKPAPPKVKEKAPKEAPAPAPKEEIIKE